MSFVFNRSIHMFSLLLIFALAGCAQTAAPDHVTVTVDFGGEREAKTIQAPWTEGMTALDALRAAAVLEESKRDDMVMVLSIDGVAARSDGPVWLYLINDAPVMKMSNLVSVSRGDRVVWQYRAPDCPAPTQ